MSLAPGARQEVRYPVHQREQRFPVMAKPRKQQCGDERESDCREKYRSGRRTSAQPLMPQVPEPEDDPRRSESEEVKNGRLFARESDSGARTGKYRRTDRASFPCAPTAQDQPKRSRHKKRFVDEISVVIDSQ